MISVFNAGLSALACAATASAQYSLSPDDIYQGDNFFDKFDFITVQYDVFQVAHTLILIG